MLNIKQSPHLFFLNVLNAFLSIRWKVLFLLEPREEMFCVNLVSGCPRKQIKRRENEALFCIQEGTKDPFQRCLNNDGYAAGSGRKFKTSETPDQQSTVNLPWKILRIQGTKSSEGNGFGLLTLRNFTVLWDIMCVSWLRARAGCSAPSLPHWVSFRKHNSWNSCAYSHLSLLMGGLFHLITFICLCCDCSPIVKLEEIDVNGITLYSVHWPSVTFSAYSQADYWLLACQLKLNMMLWLSNYQLWCF